MSNMNINLIRSKFRGCMLGALAGDCCGAPFDGDTFTDGSKLVLQKYFDTLEGPYFRAPAKKYTGDSSMTKCTAQWLAAQSKAVAEMSDPEVSRGLAKALAKEFFTDPQRGYSENVIVVFNKLRADKFADPFKPAREPANLTSSSDNGAVLRVVPLALAYQRSPERMLSAARSATLLTHTHGEGVLGALLQCVALRLCLLQEPGTVRPDTFLASLEQQLQLAEREVVSDTDDLGLRSEGSLYRKQLAAVSALCEKRGELMPTDEEVLDRLGHSNRALYSVPTAIYCFLRASSDSGETAGGPVRRALQFAVSLGGDTDTIAGMTGALAGACHGRHFLSDSLLRHCEGSELFEKLADDLLELSTNT